VELLQDVDRFDLKRLADGPLDGSSADQDVNP
jgi:hypothetical protein